MHGACLFKMLSIHPLWTGTDSISFADRQQLAVQTASGTGTGIVEVPPCIAYDLGAFVLEMNVPELLYERH